MPHPDSSLDAADSTRGFTLLEVIVVLVIISVTSGIVFPRLTTMAASYEFASRRDAFEQALNGLSYSAFRENTDKILQGVYTERGRDASTRPYQTTTSMLAPSMRIRPMSGEQREPRPPVTYSFAELSLPEGWEVVVDAPIYYRGSGLCTGGAVDLHVGRIRYSYKLRPPLCHAELTE